MGPAMAGIMLASAFRDPALTAILQMRNVRKLYGDQVVVDNLDLEVQPGQCYGLLGPNGAGKTTTVEMCEGFVRPDAGSIEILGLDPVADNAEVRARTGVMLQGGGAYPAARAGEMLRLVAAYSADPIDPEFLLDALGLTEVRRTSYRRLSGGQQQRLALACAVVSRIVSLVVCPVVVCPVVISGLPGRFASLTTPVRARRWSSPRSSPPPRCGSPPCRCPRP